MPNFTIYNGDCLDPDKKVPDGSVDLGIFDPPFGIGEAGFNKHYKRDSANVINGYTEAPPEYAEWTRSWIAEAKRVLKDDGSMYVIMGHTNLRHVLNAAHDCGLHEINHAIWKFNFGVNTKKKFVTSHYHVLYYAKSSKSNPTFNLNCRFGAHEKDKNDGSLLYKDLEDVFVINKDYAPGEKKNQNKLPEELIKKLIMYSSKPGDMVCDFFMGNFTTAYVALKTGRLACGYEINKESYDYHIGRIGLVAFGSEMEPAGGVRSIVPANQGKKITPEDIKAICERYIVLENDYTKGEAAKMVQEEFGRGRFAIKNILDDHLETFQARQQEDFWSKK